MDLWLTRDRDDDLLTLHYFEKPVKKEEIGQWWQLMFTEGDSINLPMAKKGEFPWVKWEDQEPAKVSLVPNKMLEQCDSTRKNMECSLERLHLALAHKSAKEVCDAMNEIERLSAQAIDVLSKLNKYKEE